MAPLTPLTPQTEALRLDRLRALEVLDTAAEPMFDALARAAAKVAGVPIGLMTLVDERRQWFKANVGLVGVLETPREQAFCAHTILDDAVMEVRDTRLDDRFRDNPLVTGSPDIRFYAGAPIVLSDGLRMGALCVIDLEPRAMSAEQLTLLSDLAEVAAEALDQRLLAITHAQALEREVETGKRLANVIAATGAATVEWNLVTGEARFNEGWGRLTASREIDVDRDSPDGATPWLRDLDPAERPRLEQLLDRHLRGDSALYEAEVRVRQRDGRWLWVRDRARVVSWTRDGRPEWVFGTRVDIDDRKRAEIKADLSEARAVALYASTPAILHSFDPQGRLLEVSDLWLERLGYTRDAVIGIDIAELLADESRALYVSTFPAFLASGRCDRVPYRMLRSDGEAVDVELSAVLERDGAGQPVRGMAVIEDVTARRVAERRAEKSESFLERTGAMAGVGGWELDLDTGTVIWSDETCRIHDRPVGYRPTLAEGIEYYAPEARPVIQAAVEKSFADGSSWDLELPLVTANGRRIWIRTIGSAETEDGRPRRVVGAFQDITYRRRAVQSLEASERRFRRLFQHSLGLIVTHDLAGVILSINPAAARSMGYPEADLLGRRLDEFMKPELGPLFGEYLERIGRVGNDSGVLQLVSGSGRTLLWQYHNMLDVDGDTPYVLGHAQDITARQVQMQQLRDWSVRDALTGAFNRRFLAELSASLRDEDMWGCVVIDLDRFKQVNDTHGHQRGDEVLIAMATFLQKHLRPADAVVRVGGDEFVLLLQGADMRTVERVVARYDDDRGAAPIAFTMGAAIRVPGRPLGEAIALADEQLYAARALRDASRA